MSRRILEMVLSLFLGSGGGDSPGALNADIRQWIHSSRHHRPGVSLGSGEWLLNDGQSMHGTYYPIFTTRILTAFQLVKMDVGSGDAGVCSVARDLGDDGVGV